MGRAWLPWAGAFALLFAAIYPVTLDEPYHYDTAAYMQTVRHFLSTGGLSSFYPSRPVAGYAFAVLATAFAEGTLRVTTSLAYAGSVTLASLLFLRLLESRAAIAGVVAAAATPASLMSATHGKEDFVALGFVVLASLLMRRGGWLHAALGGAAFGLALLTKELTLIVAPFVLGLALLSPARDRALRRQLLDAGLGGAASLAVLLLLSPDYPAQLRALSEAAGAQHLHGALSGRFAVGIREWRRGVGDALFVAGLAGLLTPFLERSPRCRRLALLSIGQAALLGALLTNVTALHYRLFLWPAFFALPVAAVGASRLLERVLHRFGLRGAVAPVLVHAGAAAAALAALWAVLPAVLLRKAYNPVAHFYSEIRLDPRSTVLLGMDNCIHATYFTTLECRGHPPHPDERDADAFAAQVERLLESGRSVYLLPDFFTYDRFGRLRRAMERSFAIRSVEARWYEDYHAMDFGVRAEDLLRTLRERNRGCTVDFVTGSAEAGIAAPVQMAEFGIHCPGDVEQVFSFAMTRGRILPGLHRDALRQVTPLAADGG